MKFIMMNKKDVRFLTHEEILDQMTERRQFWSEALYKSTKYEPICYVLKGSENYGLATTDSNVNIVAIVKPGIKEFAYSLTVSDEIKTLKFGKEEFCQIIDVRDFIIECLYGDSNMLELLYSRYWGDNDVWLSADELERWHLLFNALETVITFNPDRIFANFLLCQNAKAKATVEQAEKTGRSAYLAKAVIYSGIANNFRHQKKINACWTFMSAHKEAYLNMKYDDECISLFKETGIFKEFYKNLDKFKEDVIVRKSLVPDTVTKKRGEGIKKDTDTCLTKAMSIILENLR